MSKPYTVTTYVGGSREYGLDQVVSSLSAGIAYAIYNVAGAAVENELWVDSYHGSIEYNVDWSSARVHAYVESEGQIASDSDFYIDEMEIDIKTVDDYIIKREVI